jgi:Tol biopolymer transport system component
MLGSVRRRLLLASAVAGLVVAMPSAAQTASGKIGVAAPSGIYTMNPDGSGIALIRAASANCGSNGCRATPRWSPDGSLIAFHEGGALNVMDSAGGLVRTMAGCYPETAFSSQAWSPSSTELTYTCGSRVVVASIYGGVRTVAEESASVYSAAWSPDGSSIAYMAPNAQIRLVDPGGGPPKTISAGPFGRPVWSPDGQRIAFLGRGLGIMNADGSGVRYVADSYYSVAYPAWSPDGTKLLFDSATRWNGRVHQTDTFMVDTSTLVVTRLTFDAHGSDSEPAWSPDGSWITVHRGERPPAGRSRVMNADGTCLRDLGIHGEVFWQPLPNGPPLREYACHALRVTASSVAIQNGTAMLITVTLANKGTETLTGVRLHHLTGTDLTPTSVSSDRGSCSLRRIDALCGIAALGRGGTMRVFIRADGRRVARGSDAPLTTTIPAAASESLTDPDAASIVYLGQLPSCTTATPGKGLIQGTGASEEICGRRGADRIEPGRGVDRIRAGAGNDEVFARDNIRDFISCGPGRDRVYVDGRDKVGRGCERVKRIR